MKKPRQTKLDKKFCPNCEHVHPSSLFREVDTLGEVCIFCADKHTQTLDAVQMDAFKRKNESVLTQLEIDTKARMKEVDDARDRRNRERRVKETRKAEAERKGQITDASRSDMARQEIAQRELARRHLLPFVQRFNDKYLPGWVHKDICARLEKFSLDVAEKKSPRLMLFMPPRSGKSELASRSFPAWHLGRFPDHEFIATSYASDLALDFSRKVREVIRTPEYGKLFPECTLNRDTQRVDKWATEANGGYAAVGTGGPITGRGAHILVIDDPVKNREEADSEASRRSIKEWYTSTAYTRLAPGGGVLIILTRWHDDDLAGWLLSQAEKGEGDEWDVIKYPAIATEDERYRRKGDALHPARYPLDALLRIKRAVGDRDWSALYQQNPVAEDGDYFTREMFPRYRMVEQPAYDEMSYYTAWDLAIGQREQNDETFGVTVGVDRNRRLWVVDVRHGRWDSEGIVNQILDCYAVWKSDVTGIERGHIEMAIGPYLEQAIKQRGLQTMFIEKLKPGRRDKLARARPIQALMKRSEVMFRSGCDSTQYLIDQMLRFPSGVHDDGVDAMAWVGQMIQGMVTVREPRPKTTKGWRHKLLQMTRGSTSSGGHMGA